MFLRKYKNLIIIILFVILIDMISLISIKETEFPFITMSYKYNVDDFNSNELNSDLPLDKEFKEKVSEELNPILKNQKDVFFVSSVLAEYVRSHLFHKSNVIHDVNNILESPEEYPAICSGYSGFLAALAQSLGYKARVVWLNGHTVSEIYFPDYGWVLVDTSGNLIFQDKNGKYLSLLDVVENFDEVNPLRLASQTNNDHDGLSSGGYFNYKDNDIIVVIEGPRIFDFDIRTKSPKVLINYILGRQDVARGVQYIGGGREKLGNLRISLISLVIFNIFFFIIFINLICYYVWYRRHLGLQ